MLASSWYSLGPEFQFVRYASSSKSFIYFISFCGESFICCLTHLEAERNGFSLQAQRPSVYYWGHLDKNELLLLLFRHNP
jgi:hypothetical protein